MSAHAADMKSTYLKVLGVLFAGTVLTVVAAHINFGSFNDVIALAIATAKATLVILFFMHVRYSDKLTSVFVVAGFVWLAILLLLLVTDFWARDWIPDPPAL